MDNASVCDTMAVAFGIMLKKLYNVEFHSENNRIRCLAHIVNLIVQAILHSLCEADDPEQTDYFLKNKHLPFHSEDEDFEDDEDNIVDEEEEDDDIDYEALVREVEAAGKAQAAPVGAVQKVTIFQSRWVLSSDLNL